jgi:hypothetical protein
MKQARANKNLLKTVRAVRLFRRLSELCGVFQNWKGGEMRLQLSTGDMADDEREDSSTEPEPDYDVDDEDEAQGVSMLP